ncbi:MAG: DM13 domain-containing protein, partial [Thermoleophilia bacterium]|nr:DM13 domain-containing protein [Thermoleophilia bacterium]
DPSSDSDVESGRSVRLGALKGTSGDQQYVLPADVDPSEFTHAYVWCRAFSVGFTRARLA